MMLITCEINKLNRAHANNLPSIQSMTVCGKSKIASANDTTVCVCVGGGGLWG